MSVSCVCILVLVINHFVCEERISVKLLDPLPTGTELYLCSLLDYL